jgi:hypothetical protein
MKHRPMQMKECAIRKYTNSFCATLLAGAFLLYSNLPLSASPQSSSGQSSSSQSDSGRNGSALPDAPQPQSGQPIQQSPQTPSGAAGAPGANPKGAPVAQPAGAAVAPAKQHGHRSLLIKVGLLAGGAVAIGTVVALSEKSPTRPPGSAAMNRP